MPDLSPLPPLAAVPAVEPDPSQFAAARRAGHRRRAVRTAVTSGGLAACVALTTISPRGDGTALVVPTAPLVTASPTVAVEETVGPVRISAGPDGARADLGTEPSPEPSPRPGDPSPHPGDPSPHPGEPSSEPTEPAHPGDPQPSPAPKGPPWNPAAVTGTTAVVADDGTPCRAISDDTNPPWCVRSRGDSTAAAAERVRHVFEVCRTGSGDGTIKENVDESEPLALALYRGTTHVWSAKTGRRTGDITVPSGQCVRWTVHWTAVDAAGDPLAAGEYELDWWATGGASDTTLVRGTPDPGNGVVIDNGVSDSYELTVT